MSETPATPAQVETPAPQAPAAATPAPPADPAPTPPWGSADEFNPEKAWTLIKDLRADKEKLAARKVLTPDQEKDLAELTRLREASQTETERAQSAAAAAQQRVETLLARAVQAEVKALAANTFADPSDAAAFLGDVKKFANDAGEIDTAAIQAELTDLLARKPHLGKSPGGRPPAPNPAQGSSANGTPVPTQLSKEDVNRLYREGKHEEIEQARKDGRLSVLLSGG